MLILTRKKDQSIVIDNNVEVKILKIQGGQVLIGIEAPKSIQIYRHEVYEQVILENQKAVQIEAAAKEKLDSNLAKFKGLMKK